MHRVLGGEVDQQLLRLDRAASSRTDAPHWDWAAVLKMPVGPVIIGVPSVG